MNELERLSRLAAATEGIAPRSGFEDRVMSAIEADIDEPSSVSFGGWLGAVPRAGRSVLFFAALLAAGALLVAVQSQQTYTEEVALAYSTLEIGW
jgi:hypothetical protein